MSKTRVIIADDEELMLNSIANIITGTDNFEVYGLAHNGQQALDLAMPNQAELLVTDVRMPGTDGLWLLERLLAGRSAATVIIVSAYDDKDYLKAAIRNPLVFDYITKPFQKKAFIETLQAASEFHNVRHSPVSSNDFDINTVIDYIIRGNRSQALAALQRLYAADNPDKETMRRKSLAAVADIYSGLTSQQDNSNALLELSQAINTLHNSADVDQMKQVVTRFIVQRSESPRSSTDITALVGSCLQLMNKQLGNASMSLGMIAEELGVTPNYLSSRFSRDMKQNFSSYLSEMRIHAAKNYLIDIHLKVYEAALKAGFADIGHFNRVFKEHTGLTPLQYREREIKLMMKDAENRK